MSIDAVPRTRTQTLTLTPGTVERGERAAKLDVRLSFSARGILSYMFIMPDHSFSYTILSRQSRMQPAEFARIVTHLRDLGYLLMDHYGEGIE